MPYYISSDGGINDLSDRFTVENGYKSKGSFNLSYVLQLSANVSTFTISKFMPSWEVEKASEYQFNSKESVVDVNNRSRLMLDMANQNSTILAYTKAGKYVNIKGKKYFIAYITNEKVNNLKVGDELLSVNKKENLNITEIREIIANSDELTITAKRDNKQIEETIKIETNEEGKKSLGIAFFELLDYEVEPKITFNFELNESGSSAGLMTTLAIYDALTPEDLTHGIKIAGTGTIDSEGNVGEIAGVNFKIAGAEYGKADIFLVPSGENYEEAVRIKKERNYKIKIVEINTFDEAIDYLNSLQ
jgi:PDZ domain-containing protein